MDQSDKQYLSQKYYGGVAATYDATRRSGPHWQKEEAAAERMLRALMPARGGMTVLDIPVGTGRFAALYKKLGVTLIGQDISHDMLALARAACETEQLADATLEIGDAFAIALSDDAVDVALNVKFMQHIDFAGFTAVIAELKRVARTHIVLGIHMVQPDQGGVSRVLRALLASPLQTLTRIRRGLGKAKRRKHRLKETGALGGEEYMDRTDKEEGAVFDELDRIGLKVVDQAEILTSLRPGKAVSYRFLLLELPR